MKKITLVFLLIGMMGIAQVKGNKKIVTKSFRIEGLTELEMGLYAQVEIDQNASELISITADENLIPLIDFEVVNGVMKLVQKTWIEPSAEIIIKMGMPNIKRVQVGVHETVTINNVDKGNIALTAINGKIRASGTVNVLSMGIESGIIDANGLKAESVFLNIWEDGKAIVNASEVLETKLSDDAAVVLARQPKKLAGDIEKLQEKTAKKPLKNVKWIQFKIKNNSLNRNHFVVRGPKADGSKFGYGFPMMPQAVRKEKWSVGTKIYLKSKLGFNKLLTTIKKEDEGKTVKLFEK